MSASITPADDDAQKPAQIRLTIPPRFYLLPGAAIILGTTIGLFRGSRRASLRFLAENVHRMPTTLQGWYFYNKTKNYRVILGGVKEAGADALRLGTTAAGWVCFEEGVKRLGEDFEPVSEVVAGVGTAGVFSLACECSPAFTEPHIYTSVAFSRTLLTHPFPRPSANEGSRTNNGPWPSYWQLSARTPLDAGEASSTSHRAR